MRRVTYRLFAQLKMLTDNTTRVCIPLNEETVDSLIEAMRKASAPADLIELRLDGLVRGQLEKALDRIDEILSHARRPVILTLRTKEQGGYREIEQQERLNAWTTL